MEQKLYNILKRIDPLSAVTRCIAVLLAYVLGTNFTAHFHESYLLGAMLACTSAIVVMQDKDVRGSLKLGALRLLGTLIGALIAYSYLVMFHFSLVGMVVSILVLEVICMAIKIPDNGKIATITLITIMIISKETPDIPPLINGVMRFSEATIGAASGIFIVWLQYFVDMTIKRLDHK